MSYKFQQLKPQKARGVLKDSMWEDPEWVAEEKYDGDRRIAQFCGVRVRFTGTRESVDGSGFVEKTGNLPHLQNFPFSLNGTVLDGEIIYTGKVQGGGSKYVTKVMGSLPEEAIRKQKATGWLHYKVFDCLFYKGKDLRGKALMERREFVMRAVDAWENQYASLILPAEKHKKHYFDTMLKQKKEGVVLKNLAHTYGNEKLWVKVKGEWTADVIVTGFKPGKGKYIGEVGAIEFGQHRKGQMQGPPATMGFCSGFDDALRAAMTAHPKKYLDKVLRIRHNGREMTGAFRHPRFDSFREDKSSKDCVYDRNEV